MRLQAQLLPALLLLNIGIFVSENFTYEPAVPVERSYGVYFFDNEHYLETADSAVIRARADLIKLLHHSLDYKPSIYLVGDKQFFESLLGGRFPDWGAAAAVPTRRLIAIKSPDRFATHRPLPELLAHEYAHLALGHRLGLRTAPRWFDEGLAMMVSMEWGWGNNVSMGRAALFRQFVPLRDIELVNRYQEDKAQVAYAQSYLAVKYFTEQYGVASMNLFLDAIARGESADSALMTATGSNYDGFEKEYHDYLTARYNVATLFMDTMYFWLALAFLLVIGGFLAYRKRRRYYRKWEQEERLQSTDFDYGDPDAPEKPDDEDDEPWRR